jgi:hypothetical protein
VRDLVARIVTKLTTIGVSVTTVDGDLQDHPEFHRDYDAFIAPHYDANVYSGVGGSFWGRAQYSLTAEEDDRLGGIFWRRYSALPGKPADHFERINANVTNYYGFRLTSAKTPGILVEHGVGAQGAPDYQWLRGDIEGIAQTWVDTLVEFTGYQQPAPTDMLVLAQSGTFLDPAGWADLYRQEAPKAGIRAEVAYAQALHETDYFKFTRIARPEWNNPAGLGVLGPPDIGNRFASKRDGVVAHLQHLLMYFAPAHTPYCTPPTLDQRHYGHRGYPNDIRQLNGHWAVPGDGYGEAILAIVKKIKTGG